MGEGRPETPRAIHPEVRAGAEPEVSSGTEGGAQNPPAVGRKTTRTSRTGARITPSDAATALKLTESTWGLRKRIATAAAALGISEDSLRAIVDTDPSLRAAYGSTGSHRSPVAAGTPRAPTQTEILDREDDDIPHRAVPGEKTSVELIGLVSEAERELHLKGLEAIGVNEKTVEKLRRLDGLASSTAAFIAIGLEKTHRLYYLAVVDLKTVADQIKERYLDDPNAVTNEERPYYYRNYIDAVKEFGRAYDLFIQGAAVILKIVGSGDSDDSKSKKGKTRLGFSGRSLKLAQKTGTDDAEA